MTGYDRLAITSILVGFKLVETLAIIRAPALGSDDWRAGIKSPLLDQSAQTLVRPRPRFVIGRAQRDHRGRKALGARVGEVGGRARSLWNAAGDERCPQFDNDGRWQCP